MCAGDGVEVADGVNFLLASPRCTTRSYVPSLGITLFTLDVPASLGVFAILRPESPPSHWN